MKDGNILVMKRRGRKLINDTKLLYCCPMYRKGAFLDKNLDNKYLVGMFRWGLARPDDWTQN